MDFFFLSNPSKYAKTPYFQVLLDETLAFISSQDLMNSSFDHSLRWRLQELSNT